MAIKKKKPVNKITELNKKIKELEESYKLINEERDELQVLVNKIKGAFSLYLSSSAEQIFEAIGALRAEKINAIKELKAIQGSINERNEVLLRENSKLWYLIRVAMKDESTKLNQDKPGEEREYDSFQKHTNPFLR